MMRRGQIPWLGARRPRPAGMTLIELIVVMALLATILAITSPSLGRFFGGRGLSSQARRFLQLTRYGQQQAISAGIPMDLWINAEQGQYGLSPVAGFGYQDPKPLSYLMGDKQKIELDEPQSEASQAVNRDKEEVTSAKISFLPDGRIDEGSIESLRLLSGDGDIYTIQRIKDEDGNNFGAKFEIVKGDPNQLATDRRVGAAR